MVSSKTIENLQWCLQNHWNLQWIPKKHWTCQWSSQINILLKQLNYPVVTITILIWLCCSKVYCQSSLIFIAAHCSYKPNLPHPTLSIVNLKTIVDHCPQNFENHRKTIGSNGWTPKKHSMVMVQLCQNHWKTIDGNGGLKKNINHSIALKNWPSLWSIPPSYVVGWTFFFLQSVLWETP